MDSLVLDWGLWSAEQPNLDTIEAALALAEAALQVTNETPSSTTGRDAQKRNGHSNNFVLPPGSPSAAFANNDLSLTKNALAGLLLRSWAERLTPIEIDDMLKEITDNAAFLPLADAGRGEWRDLVWSIKAFEPMGATVAYRVARQWSETSEKYEDGTDFHKVWRDGDPNRQGSRIGPGTLLKAAENVGVDLTKWKALADAERASAARLATIPPMNNPGEIIAGGTSEDDALIHNVEALAEEYGEGRIAGAKLQAGMEELAAKHNADLKKVRRLFDAEAKRFRSTGSRGSGQESQASRLVRLAGEAELFHSLDGTGYANVTINGHRETLSIRSKGFRRWLARRFYETAGSAAGGDAFQSAMNVIEAKAHFDGSEWQVYVRIAGRNGKLYLDLADNEWRAVEIDAAGWRVVAKPPVRFRRPAGLRPLPVPEPGGSVELLRPYVNVASADDFVLLISYLLAAFRDRGPYPILALFGAHGSAKSFLAALVRLLVDPNVAPLRSLPREDRDLFIAATNGHIVAFDNVSTIPPWISDTLCRLATGGGFGVRALYTDGDEALFDATRPVMLTGITDYVQRPDLADRTIFLTLKAIDDDTCRPQEELMAAFEAVRPKILGALLNAVAHGLKMLPQTQLARLPRMADFAIWATACEGALWSPGTFLAAYENNRDEANETVLANDAVARAVRALVEESGSWSGSASELLDALTEQSSETAVRRKDWPKAANALSNRLRRVAPGLRRAGIAIETGGTGRGREKRKGITISWITPENEDK